MLLLMLLTCRVDHQGLYHRVGLPPSHASHHFLPHVAHPYVRIHTVAIYITPEWVVQSLVTMLYSSYMFHVLS